MDPKQILRHCDHTLLRPTATWPEIRQVCDDALAFGCASACIPPAYIRQAAGHVGNELKLCTVIGFPNGSSTTAVKVFETEDAIRGGADEIDMVINLGWVKEERWDDVLGELRAVKASCRGRILKVIVEACLLDRTEKIRLCRLITEAGADYIKTSTGFSTGGATREDVALFRAYIGPEVKIKAAGGIRTLEDAADFLLLGADRLGTSAIVSLVKAAEEGKQTTADL
ncbi:deoxyribose-phosphate aldolase [Flavonifractor sp. DFI.6.63]|uniref:deoxyribose-phosphate aldolase n=1 Tax=Oscillospiraceae TaxID=216572 RepID=UPI002108F8B5|nr:MULTISPECIES: deoxyribose-phosphate aldolase [Oscillospiraceae]MBS1385273.1 deoxyribose-phosphate aldolase [Flavonifractor sp.]MCI6397761.1 deoxyribose-phosphate aldolase [Lawsonibacter sp.]MCQ5030213.1 deoxyribose-phosphate aldolase [Flavonifractor sp. DFI.6.63]